MSMQMELQEIIYMFLVPYCIWVTVSLFNQRQELALLRKTLDDLSEVFKEFKENSCRYCKHSKE